MIQRSPCSPESPKHAELSKAIPVAIYGCGGHGQVVADAATAAGLQPIGFVDDKGPRGQGDKGPSERPDPSAPWPLDPCLPVLTQDDPQLKYVRYIVAIGANADRRRVMAQLREAGRQLITVIHPSASVSDSASIGIGCFIGPLCVVQAHCQIGDGAIINSASIIEHHNIIGRCAHVAPGVVLGGQVKVGSLSLVGLGSRVLPRMTISENCTIGAGSVVTRNVNPGQTVKGNPAKPIR